MNWWQRQLRSSASNGCSVPRTFWAATFGGPIIGDATRPRAIRIFHHKTGAVVLHPLQDVDGTLFYSDAEEVLAKVPRRGIPMIPHETGDKTEYGQPKPIKLYSESGMAKLAHRLRDEAGLLPTFTLDACRHGGMTELEEAELTG
jgi:hypothetical protein